MKKTNKFLPFIYLLSIVALMGVQPRVLSIVVESEHPESAPEGGQSAAEGLTEDQARRAAANLQASREATSTTSIGSTSETATLIKGQEAKPVEVTLKEEGKDASKEGKGITGTISTVVSSAIQAGRSGISALSARAQEAINNIIKLLTQLIMPNTSSIIESPGYEWEPTVEPATATTVEEEKIPALERVPEGEIPGETPTTTTSETTPTETPAEAGKGTQIAPATSPVAPTAEQARISDYAKETASTIQSLSQQIAKTYYDLGRGRLNEDADADQARMALRGPAASLSRVAMTLLQQPELPVAEKDQLKQEVISLFTALGDISSRLLSPNATQEEQADALNGYKLYISSIQAIK